MSILRRRSRAALGTVATFGLVLGGAVGASAGASDDPGQRGAGTVDRPPVVAPSDRVTGDEIDVPAPPQISEIIAEPWVYVYEWTTASVEVSGVIPAGAYLEFDAFDGPGGGTCDPEDSVGIVPAPAVLGIVSDPEGWVPRQVGLVGWTAVLRSADGTALDATGCGVIEARAYFTDVPGDHPFFEPIQQLAVAGVTEGYQPGPQFKPAQPQSRQGLAAFLYRYLTGDAPLPGCAEAPFTDVPTDSPFCAEITWLKDEGILSGYDDGSFRPGATVSRQSGAAIIARARGAEPGLTCEEDLFPDVPAGSPFCGEIAWLGDFAGIRGYGDGTFRPNAPMSRQAMAAWLDTTFLK